MKKKQLHLEKPLSHEKSLTAAIAQIAQLLREEIKLQEKKRFEKTHPQKGAKGHIKNKLINTFRKIKNRVKNHIKNKLRNTLKRIKNRVKRRKKTFR
jgi:hypothetical protein